MDKEMKILEGKTIAKRILKEIEGQTKEFFDKPRLDIFLIGNDFASSKYVVMKEKAATEVGIKVVVHKYDETISQEALVTQITDLGGNPDVDGIMVQLPLPLNFDTNVIVNAIDKKKDVDGLSALSIGKTFTKDKGFLPATVRAIKEIITTYEIEVVGKNVVIIGASREVGVPTAGLMLSLGATVSICHAGTKDLAEFTKEADLVVSATGVAGIITKEMIDDDCILIDVGFSLKDGKVYGDVDFENICGKVAALTPVPGGVGPVTVACLLANTLDAYRKNKDV